jgi:hypothetical protein
MNHYLVCENPTCRFVLDLRLNGNGTGIRRLGLSKCPQCSGNWSAGGPVSRRALGARWAGKLPHCPCCRERVQVRAA